MVSWYNIGGGDTLRVLVDADACPVVRLTVSACQKTGIDCLLFCDTAHQLHIDGAETLVFDKGADSVDFALANRVSAGDLVITQDYGLASMCLAKRAKVLHQDGWLYTENNIQALLFQRHEAKVYRAAGGRTKGPSKRKPDQDKAFLQALNSLLQQSVQG